MKPSFDDFELEKRLDRESQTKSVGCVENDGFPFVGEDPSWKRRKNVLLDESSEKEENDETDESESEEYGQSEDGS